MLLYRAADLLEHNISEARSPAYGAEPEVRIPVSMVRMYLESIHEGLALIDALHEKVGALSYSVDLNIRERGRLREAVT